MLSCNEYYYFSNALAFDLNNAINNIINNINFLKEGEIMYSSEHRRINKRCVSVRAFEEEPEYYSFSDNYDYGDVDYGHDSE